MKRRALTLSVLPALLLGICLVSCAAPASGVQATGAPATETPTTELPTTPPRRTAPSGLPVAEAGEVVLSEVCPANHNAAAMADGTHPDFIELYNASSGDLSLWGLCLSDGEADPATMTLPDLRIGAGEYLVLWAVGQKDYDALSPEDRATCLPFKISASGESVWFFTSEGTVLDHLECPALGDDLCWGLLHGAGSAVGILTPTPGATNEGHARALAVTAAPSRPSGFYDDAFDLTWEVPEGYELYYTLWDCTDPRTSATAIRYVAPVRVEDASGRPNSFSQIQVASSMYYPDCPIDKCTVVRYALCDAEGLWTDVSALSFFVGFGDKEGYENMTVVSLVADYRDLYDKSRGIFVNGNWNNRGINWERAAAFACFDTDGTLLSSQTLGIRVQGSSTRAYQQKSMSLFARSEYGTPTVEGDLFPGVEKLKSLTLRYDRDYKFGEGLIFSLVRERDVDVAEYRPCVVFLEGEYYGIYNLYVHTSDHELADKYGLEEEGIAIIKKGALEEGTAEDLADYNALLKFASTADLGDPENYRRFCEEVDVESLIDYVCAQTYLCNVDWSQKQNFSAWRTSRIDPANPWADGRWRFILYDMDFAIGYANSKYDQTLNAFTQVQPYTKVAAFSSFNSLLWGCLQNADFRAQFARTFLDMAQSTFAPARVRPLLQGLLDTYAPNMETHYERFDGYTSAGAKRDENTYRSRTAKYFTFFEERFDYAAEDLAEVMEIPGTLCGVTVGEAEGGAAYLNSIRTPVGGQTLYYFDGMTLTLTAIAEEGYTFAGWTVVGLSGLPLDRPVLSFVLPEGGVTLTPVFLPCP